MIIIIFLLHYLRGTHHFIFRGRIERWERIELMMDMQSRTLSVNREHRTQNRSSYFIFIELKLMTVLEFYGNWLELRVIYRCNAKNASCLESAYQMFLRFLTPQHEAPNCEQKPECSWLNFCCHLMCGMIRIILSQDAICYVDICCKHIIRCVSGVWWWAFSTECQPYHSWDIQQLHFICIWIHKNEITF